MIKYKLLRPAIFLITLLFLGTVYGQSQISVKGTVLDGKTHEPLIGVTVQEKGTVNGTVTDLDGKFVLQITPGSILIFSYTGYDSREIAASAGTEMSVLLDEKTEVLSEVVVVGYGVQKKSDVTGSISSVSAKDINNVPVASALQALQGKASGVNIIQNSGAPGGGTTIKIRGTGTVNDADPLYVVDGFIVDEINHINPSDIANIEIFKDAASSAIYGARGANGVVAITTKSGEEGTMRVTFDAYAGISNPWKTIPVMGLDDYALMRDYVTNQSNYSVDGRLYYSKNTAQEYYFDEGKHFVLDTLRRNSIDNWWDAVTQIGIKQQYSLSVSGGSNKNKYMVSASYYNEEGIVKTSDYRRFNARMNLNSQLTGWLNLTANMAFTNENRHIVPEGQNGVLKRALYQSPMTYTYNDRGYWADGHPLAVIDRNHNQRERYRIDLNMSLTAQILKLLTYQFRISNNVSFDDRSRFTEVNKLDEDFVMADLSTVQKTRNLTNKWELNNLLTFAWNNEMHDITLLTGQILEGYNRSYLEAIRRGTASNDDYLQYLNAAYTGDKAYGLDRNWSAVGFVGRVNYNVLDRYLFQANFRADASSIFSKANRWGYFPSVSVGWKFTSEPFMQSATEWLSFGKLRFGWGQLGNNRIDELARFTIMDMQYNYSYGVGGH
ncbi:MAG: SusC/RagA family TonB-linked outer membrane protein, partial [Cytophagaceae bacterium]|nr:SusC/RagA family TonB-linked outer membrane protein [Cytophagaceae bacterium]